MPESDLKLLIRAARAAGEVASRYTADSVKTWDKPDDAGPVTQADLAVNDKLHEVLQGARHDYGWLSEESEDGAERLDKKRLFIVDPIDGTRSFIEGSNTWAHSLAVVDNGSPVAAVIYLPKRDMLYAAALGQGATLNGTPIQIGSRNDLDGAEALTVKFNLKPEYWRGEPPALERAYRPSLAYRMALVAEGKFDAMITFRDSWEWDVAAGDLILREAGAITSDRFNAPLMFNNRTPKVEGVLAANSALHTEMTKRLKFKALMR